MVTVIYLQQPGKGNTLDLHQLMNVLGWQTNIHIKDPSAEGTSPSLSVLGAMTG